jgi:hypothetical protein
MAVCLGLLLRVHNFFFTSPYHKNTVYTVCYGRAYYLFKFAMMSIDAAAFEAVCVEAEGKNLVEEENTSKVLEAEQDAVRNIHTHPCIVCIK